MSIHKFVETLEWGLVHGCNTSLEEIENSSFFERILEEQTENSLVFPKSPLDFVKKSAEKGEIHEDFIEPSKGVAQARKNAWILSFGQSLIDESKKLLPQKAHELAGKFHGADAQTQQEVCADVCELLKSVFQTTYHLQEPELGALTHTLLDSVVQNVEKQLPASILNSNDLSSANCLMITQLLSAWAQLTGAKFFLADVLSTSSGIVDRFVLYLEKYSTNQAILNEDMFGMNVLNEVRKNYLIEEARQSLVNRGFHAGIVIQLSDGQWMLMDVFGSNWGIMKDVWNLKWAAKNIEFYTKHLPGFSLARTDNGLSTEFVNDAYHKCMRYVDDYAYMAKRLKDYYERHLDSCGETYSELGQKIMDSEVFEYQLLHDGFSSDSLSEEGQLYFALQMFLGKDSLDKINDSKEPEREALSLAISLFLIRPYLFPAMELGNDLSLEERGGKLRHPEIEFSEPVYGVGSRVFREVAWHLGLEEAVLSPIWKASTSQFALYDQIYLFESPIAKKFSASLPARVKPLNELLASIEARDENQMLPNGESSWPKRGKNLRQQQEVLMTG